MILSPGEDKERESRRGREMRRLQGVQFPASILVQYSLTPSESADEYYYLLVRIRLSSENSGNCN